METSSGEISHPSLACYRMDKEMERFKKEREEEMGKEQGEMRRALSMILHHCWFWKALSAA
jgi:hypothetical protein